MTHLTPIPDDQFHRVLSDLEKFGTKGHERIELQADRSGHFIPVTTGKVRGISWFIQLFYKSPNKRAGIVAKQILQFLNSHKDKIQNPENIGRFRTIYERLNRLMDGQVIEIGGQQRSWKALGKELCPKAQAFWQQAVEIRQQAYDQAMRDAATRREMLAEANRIKSKAQEDAAHLRGEAQKEKLREIVSVPSADQGLALRLRQTEPSESEAIYFIAKSEGNGLEEEGQVRIKAHKSVLETYAQGENFFRGFFAKGRGQVIEQSNSIELGSEYPPSTIHMLLDFLYGVPKKYHAKDLQDLLGVLALTDALGIDTLHEQCKGICHKLLNEFPSLVLDSILIPENVSNPVVSELIFPKFNFNIFNRLSSSEKEKFYQNIEELPDCAYSKMLKGLCFQTASGVEHDNQRAFTLFQEAEAQGDVLAQFRLGCCYQYGRGVEKNAIQAVNLYQQAADRGLPHAQDQLGYCYQYGIGVEKDITKAFNLYQQAADRGLPDAQSNLGYCYQQGIGVEKDVTKAFNLYQQAADQGLLDAQTNLAYCYQYGIGVKKDVTKAFNLYQQAANQGNARAQIGLGISYEQGVVVAKNNRIAFELYQKAANQGNAQAIFYVGECYKKGIGVAIDRSKASEFYQKAANLGYTG